MDIKSMETVTILKGSRNRMYFPILMPLTKDGNGPADIHEIDKITFQVWDRFCESYGEFDYLSDAIDKADELNAEYLLKEEGE